MKRAVSTETVGTEVRFRVAEGVVGEVLEGEAVLLDTRSGHYYRLNRTGTRLWESLERDGRLSCALDSLLHDFDIDPVRLRRDVQSVLAELEVLQLLVREEAKNG